MTRRLARLLLFSVAVAACGKSGPTAPSTTPPVLENLSTDIEPFNPSTSLAGDVLLQPLYIPFSPFGRATTDSAGNPKVLPTMDFLTQAGTPVVAAIDGVVANIFDQGTRADGTDYEVLIRTTTNTKWFVSYDHVTNLQVSLGATVHVGQALAYPYPYSADVVYLGSRLAAYELMVGNEQESLGYCPIDYLDPAVKDTFRAKVTQLMSDIVAHYPALVTYDLGAMVEPGCLAHSAPA